MAVQGEGVGEGWYVKLSQKLELSDTFWNSSFTFITNLFTGIEERGREQKAKVLKNLNCLVEMI